MSKINYDLKRVKGLVFDVDGVLSPVTVPTGTDGVPQRMANVRDGYALQLAVKHGYNIAIITGGVSEAVLNRCKILGITDVYMGVSVKIGILHDWMKRHSLSPEEIAYVGDDVPDYECMLAVGLSVTPADWCTDVKNIARYISPVSGGYGVARDLIEEIMRAKGEWMNSEHAFGW